MSILGKYIAYRYGKRRGKERAQHQADTNAREYLMEICDSCGHPRYMHEGESGEWCPI